MPLNMMGLGFSFMAVDQGLQGALYTARNGFSDLSAAFDTARSVAQKFTSDGVALTTSLEAQRFASDTTARRMAANYGVTGEEAKKLRGQAVALAEGLNIQADAATKALVAAHRLSEVKDLGFSGTDLAKFQDVLGVDVLKFSESLRRGGKELGLTGTELKEFTERLIDTGQNIGDTGGFVDQTGWFMEHASKMKQLLPSIKFDTLTTDIMGTANALRALGLEPQNVIKSTQQMTDVVANANETWNEMLAGAGDFFQGVPLSMSIVKGNLDETLRAMETGGPSKMLQTFAEQIDRMRASGESKEGIDKYIAFFRGQFQSKLPGIIEPFSNVLTKIAGPNGAAAFQAFMESFKVGRKTLQDFNKENHNVLRTAQEWMALAEDQFEVRLRKLGTMDKGDFLKAQKTALNDLNSTLEGLAKDQGPLGQITNKLVDVSKFGVFAILPDHLRDAGFQFGALMKTLSPALASLKDLGFELFSFTSPLKALGLLGATVGMKFLDNLGKVRKEGAEAGTDIDEALALTEVDMNKMFDSFNKAIDDFLSPGNFGKMVPLITNFVGLVLSSVNKAIRLFIDNWKQHKDAILAVVKPLVGDSMTLLKDLVAAALPEIRELLIGGMKFGKELYGIMKPVFDELSGLFSNFLTGDIWPKIQPMIDRVIDHLIVRANEVAPLLIDNNAADAAANRIQARATQDALTADTHATENAYLKYENLGATPAAMGYPIEQQNRELVAAIQDLNNEIHKRSNDNDHHNTRVISILQRRINNINSYSGILAPFPTGGNSL